MGNVGPSGLNCFGDLLPRPNGRGYYLPALRALIVRINSKIDDVDQHLNMSLGLKAATHNAERHEQLVVFEE